jgi:hypothetical protein
MALPRPAIAAGVSARSLPSGTSTRLRPAALGDRAGQIPTAYGGNVQWRRLGGSPRRVRIWLALALGRRPGRPVNRR